MVFFLFRLFGGSLGLLVAGYLAWSGSGFGSGFLLCGFGRFVFLWMGFSFAMLFPPSSPTDGLLLLVGGG